MTEYTGTKNPFRGQSIKIFQDWLHHVKYKHLETASDLYELGVKLKRKEKIWDLTNEISKKKFKK